MASIDKLMETNSYQNLSKRERLQVQRERAKLEKQLGSIADLNRLPSALFVVDINKEHIAVAEARKLNIPTFAIVDTNSDPTKVDFPIPANDDASKSIDLITKLMVKAVEEGLVERKLDRDKKAQEKEEEEEAIRVKAQSLEEAEEEEEEEVSRRKRAKAVKVKVGEESEKNGEDKPEKRPRKSVSKPGKRPLKK